MPNLEHAPLPVRLALEWFDNGGERTRARLRGLIEHFAMVYAMPDQIDAFYTQALDAIPAWKWVQ